MTELTFLDDVEVRLIRSMGDDDAVIQAAQVSVTGENEAGITMQRKAGLINYLMRKRHGSPFEHGAMTFYVKAPIFVFREFHRHRIGFSYNEMSGRYTKLLPEFYVPKETRPLVNVGTSANPQFKAGTPDQIGTTAANLINSYEMAWTNYERLLEQGIGNEVARALLPVGIYSQQYVTTNPRALMNFLGLRTNEPTAMFPSNPQHEIELVARKMEAEFAKLYPLTYTSFNKNGRVAP